MFKLISSVFWRPYTPVIYNRSVLAVVKHRQPYALIRRWVFHSVATVLSYCHIHIWRLVTFNMPIFQCPVYEYSLSSVWPVRVDLKFTVSQWADSELLLVNDHVQDMETTFFLHKLAHIDCLLSYVSIQMSRIVCLIF